jgi:YfiH family protein
MKIHQKGLIRYITFSSFDKEERIVHGLFLRQGGCSPEPWQSLNLSTTVGDSRENVIENRTRIMEVLNLPKDDFFDVWQIHSTNVIETNKPRSRDQNYIQADAIITNTPGVALLMRFADCVPILLYDPVNYVIGLVHAGWMGSIQKIVKKTVKRMQEVYGSNPEKVITGIGPSIGIENYPVGTEVIEQTKRAFPLDWKKLLKKIGGQDHLDLWKTNELVLRELGVAKIEHSRICTAANTSDWYSHRGEKGKTGRFGVVICIK